MGSIATFTPDDSIAVLRTAWRYTVSRLLKNPLTTSTSFAPDFQALGPTFDAASKTQSDLDDASVIAAAGRDAADDALDPLLGQIINALLIVTRNDREDPLFVSYVGAQTPAEIVRPLLGAELVTAAEWVEPLQQEPDPVLQGFAAPLAEVVATGQAAEKDVKAADKALSDFRLVGERKRLVDAFNAARGNLFGALVKFQHENTKLRLPSDWAESFFPRTAKSAKYGSTVAQAEATVTKLAGELEAAQENLKELKQKAADREDARAKRAQARVDLAASRKAGREKRQQEKALEAEAKKKLT
jgi:hypothetical protein